MKRVCASNCKNAGIHKVYPYSGRLGRPFKVDSVQADLTV